MLELLTEFSGNVMHSNWEIGLKTYPRGFIPRKIATISNTKSYKNRYVGFQMAHTGNLIIDGGYFGDNRINIDMMRNNAITIKNIDISGYSNSYKALKTSNKHDIPTHCNANYPMTGIRVDTKEMQDDEGLTVLENINFSNFDTKCNLDAVAINVKPSCSICIDWTAIVKISKLTHQDVPKKINLCSASEVTGISIVDSDGSLNPLRTGSGVVVGADFNDNLCQILSDGNSCSNLGKRAWSQEMLMPLSKLLPDLEDLELLLKCLTASFPRRVVSGKYLIYVFLKMNGMKYQRMSR